MSQKQQEFSPCCGPIRHAGSNTRRRCNRFDQVARAVPGVGTNTAASGGDWRSRKTSPGLLCIMPQKRPFFSDLDDSHPHSRLAGCKSREESIEGRIEARFAGETEAWERSSEGLLPAPTLTEAVMACFHCTHVLCRKTSKNLAREVAQSVGPRGTHGDDATVRVEWH
jgi:hypothetical protein